jgi:spermidine synthase
VPSILSRVRQALGRRVGDRTAAASDNELRAERTEFVRQFELQSDETTNAGASSVWTQVAVFLASACGLYLEMVMVRWHSSCMHTFGVFKNVSMLSCFLGLGIGYAIAGRSRPIRFHQVLPLLALQCLTFAIISRTRLGRLSLNPVAEHYTMWQSDWRWWCEGLGGNIVLATTFLVNALMFIPIGHLTGELMRRLSQLVGYALNLTGSVVGVGLFVLLSALWTPPIVWMGIASLALILLYAVTSDRGAVVHPGKVWVINLRSFAASKDAIRTIAFRPVILGLASLAMMLVAFGIVDRPGVQHLYSPYQTITCQLGPDSKYPCVARIMVNQASFQRVLNLSLNSQRENAALERIAQYYDLPHQVKPDARDVLIVGAGSGNDVAAALRATAESVIAVEIDPTILFLGERMHPERPYADPRVRTVNDDARTFLRNSQDRYDMIIYGLLDSHTMHGSMANVRLDSFVYTIEAFREAAAHLRDNGLLAVTFAVMTPQQGKKLYTMLERAFDGHAPRCFEVGYDGGVMMLAGPAADELPAAIRGLKEATDRFADPRLVAEASTDDWPFFYMPRRTYPLTYAVMIVVLLAISGAMIYRMVGLPGRAGELFGPFFFLGAGFMLIETKAITQLGLVLGNNWHVLAIVVASIMLLAFVANVWVMRRGPASRVGSFALLVGSLLAGTALSWAVSSGWQIPAAKMSLTLALTLPLCFSGVIFSGELARGAVLTRALASNLFGAMLGGFLEYNAMYFGYSSLTWFGLAIYAAAFVCICGPDFRTAARRLLPGWAVVRPPA